MVSIISEYDSIKAWINTSSNYHVGSDFGNNFTSLLFLNGIEVKLMLNGVYDKIENDLGIEVAMTIDDISILHDDDNDNFILSIRYDFEKFALAKLERV